MMIPRRVTRVLIPAAFLGTVVSGHPAIADEPSAPPASFGALTLPDSPCGPDAPPARCRGEAERAFRETLKLAPPTSPVPSASSGIRFFPGAPNCHPPLRPGHEPQCVWPWVELRF